MGITKTDATFLFYARNQGVDFSHTCTLGRMVLYAGKQDITRDIEKYGSSLKMDEVAFTDQYAEPFFKILGATVTDSMDYSDYENASVIHDLNKPVKEDLYGKYTCVLDSGTLEHVFNFPEAVRSCMKMVKTGGHYIGISPVNNQMGHGFYQFSPELYYRIFSAENGFRIVRMVIAVPAGEKTSWYEVADPKTVKNRVMLVNNFPVALMFIARKEREKDIFTSYPQQSDYVTTWNAIESLKKPIASGGSFMGNLYKRFMPYRLKVFLRNVVNLFIKEKIDMPGLGVVDPEHYKMIEI